MAGADPLRREALVRRRRVRMQEDHGDRVGPLFHQDIRFAVDLLEVQRHEHGAVRDEPLIHLAPTSAGHQRIGWRVPPVVDVGPGSASELEHIPEASRGDEPDGRAPLLEDRVQHDGGAVDERVEVGRADGQPVHGRHDLLGTSLGRGRLLLGHDLAGGPIDHDEIDEGPAHVDGDPGTAGVTVGRHRRVTLTTT